jgi:hypothetical protein
MADLPPEQSGGPRWLTILGIVLVGAILAFVVVAHLTGLIGPGVHGPAGPVSPSSSITQSPSPSSSR